MARGGPEMDVSLFKGDSLLNVFRSQEQRMTSEIERFQEEKIQRGVDQLVDDLYKDYMLETPTLHAEKKYELHEGEEEIAVSGGDGNSMRIAFVGIVIPFSGNEFLFHYTPSQSPLVDVKSQIKKDGLYLEYRIDGRQSDEVKRDIQSDIDTIEQYLESVRKDVTKYNSGIRDIARQHIEKRIEQLKENREVIEGLGIPNESR